MYQIDIIQGYFTEETLYATTLDVALAFCNSYAKERKLTQDDPDWPFEWQGEYEEMYLTELDVMDSVDAAEQVAEVMIT